MSTPGSPRFADTSLATTGMGIGKMKKYSASTVAVVQASPVIFDAERTLEKVRDLTADAAARGAGLVLFPEAFISASSGNLELREKRVSLTSKVGPLYPSRQEFKEAWPAAVRGTVVGSLLGILPGGGAALLSFASYAVEKKVSRHPERFGQGHPAGVAGPESANNAGSQTSFIPLLTLGIPGNPATALMIGAMMILGVQPGPLVISSHPDLFWGLIVSMWIGNLALIILNLPLVGLWVKLLDVPYRILYPAILVFCAIGVYTLNSNVFDIYVTAVFGLVGYVWAKLKCEGAPLLLGLVLGPMMEENFRRALLLSRGDLSVFVTRPLSMWLLISAAVLIVLVALPAVRKKREVAFAGED
ncbi:hypothetical protein CDEF62S_02175 [Castellaniella defragrans]